MNELKWTVSFTWAYDEDKYVYETQTALDEGRITENEINRFIRNLITHDVGGEDDYLYYNFGENEYQRIISRVKDKLMIQTSLFD